MENNTNQTDNLFDITYDSAAGNYLKQAATWARICAVIAFISAGLTLIKSFGGGRGNMMAAAASVAVSLIVVAISILINVFLLRFANNTLTGLANANQEQLNEGVSNLGTYFKIVGILIIVCLALFVIYLFAAFFFMSRLR
jgi:hypothetical protein